MKNIKVMKFGGASLASGEKILHVAKIIKSVSRKNGVIVIVSAMTGVTDSLISIFQNYKLNNTHKALEIMRNLYFSHYDALKKLDLKEKQHKYAENCLKNLFGKLSLSLTLNKRFSSADYDYVISFGERFSSCLVSSALNQLSLKAITVDGSSVIVSNEEFNNGRALIKETKEKAIKCLYPLVKKGIVPIVSGFFAASKKGEVVTLGRGGSDYSATIIANALDANEVILWKEVNGVFSSDPKKNIDALFYPELSYEQALKLAQNGAKILHPEAMKPVSSKKIVVWVKNVFNPEFVGTKIWAGKQNILVKEKEENDL